MVAEEVARPVPLLMLSEKEGNEEKRELFDIAKGVTYTVNFPELVTKHCFGVGIPGWLFTADLHGNLNLFHLNSRSVIELPGVQTLEGFKYELEFEDYIHKAVLSADPHTTNDYILMINQGVPRSLAYWKPGMMSFITVTSHRKRAYSDVTWHEGQFYGVDFRGYVIIFDFRGGLVPNPSTGTGIRVVQGVPSEFIAGMNVYIVHSSGELFVITRYVAVNESDTIPYGAKEFIVSKIDLDNETYEDIDDLGNSSLFLGYSASQLVVDEQCKANHIYFTDDCWEAYRCFGEKGGGKDMGIYNLFDDTIEPLYPGESYHRYSPPILIFNTPNFSL